MESDIEEYLRKRPRKYPLPGDSSRKQFEHLTGRSYSIMGENFMQDGDIHLMTTRTWFANLLKRHGDLTERFSRDSDKIIFERLLKDFEDARSSQTEQVCLDGEQWNDGLLGILREQVHMEAERKAILTSWLALRKELFIKLGTSLRMRKLVFDQPYETYVDEIEKSGLGTDWMIDHLRFGSSKDWHTGNRVYHCVLESKSFLEKMTVLEHTIPFFLPIREAEKGLLSSNAMKFIDYVGDLLQAYVDRREQVRLIKELYGNQIGEPYHSLPYYKLEFVLDDFECKVTVSLRYADLISVLPTKVSVLRWPMHQSKKNITNTALLGSNYSPIRLTYAEDALRSMSLPEGYAEIVLNLPQALQQMI